MTVEGKIFPNENAARAGITAAEATWTRPTYYNTGSGRHTDHASLPVQRLAEPLELDDNTWFVVADHPSMKGDHVPPERIRGVGQGQGGGQGQGAQAQGKGRP
jgi:hypothetical protein